MGHRQKLTPLVERIARKIQAPRVTTLDFEGIPGLPFDRSVCWKWNGAFSSKTRGTRDGRWIGPRRPMVREAGRGSRMLYTFRVTLSLRDGIDVNGPPLLYACHLECDDPDCVNPWHGYWGTQQDNHDDRMRRQPETFVRKEHRDTWTPPTTAPASSTPSVETNSH